MDDLWTGRFADRVTRGSRPQVAHTALDNAARCPQSGRDYDGSISGARPRGGRRHPGAGGWGQSPQGWTAPLLRRSSPGRAWRSKLMIAVSAPRHGPAAHATPPRIASPEAGAGRTAPAEAETWPAAPTSD